ncbi:MAG: dihydroorotate dehydrogenase [Candidatus Omnitrophica bacterium]|nr:dihydroorotate dehydrogenase [Candidatus Omnitrophota bacterium]
MIDWRVAIASLTLRNPVLVAAGTFGYGLEFARAVRLERLGALITKTLTRTPRQGNPPPRLVETPSGMLNAVGLQNIGLDAFLQERLPPLRAYRVPIIVSILGEPMEDAAAMARALDHADGVSAIELNLSCPNLNDSAECRVPSAELGTSKLTTHHSPLTTVKMVAQDPAATAEVVQAVRQQTRKPLIAKLSPDVTDLVPIARAAVRGGADALSIGNTFVGMSLDPLRRASRLGTLTGGLSGPAIRPLAVYRVWYTAQAVSVPIIGVGGIVRAEDALEFFLAGASAVAIGTANFADPRAPLRIVQGLERYLNTHHVESLSELRGAINRTTAFKAQG